MLLMTCNVFPLKGVQHIITKTCFHFCSGSVSLLISQLVNPRNVSLTVIFQWLIIRGHKTAGTEYSLTVRTVRLRGSILSSFEPVSEQYAKEVCLKAALKTCELNPGPSALLRGCLYTLLPHVTHVMNDSLRSGSFPTVFKFVIVRPLLKKPSLDPNCLKNYRPVSNLS